MTVKPKAESIFEEFCNLNTIPCEKIPENVKATPDYKVILNGTAVLVEVKQIDTDNDFTNKGSSRTLGSHVRAKINEARKQLKSALNQNIPAILLIYNNLDPWQAFGTEQQDFIAAMYGEPTVVFNLNENRITDSYEGRNRSFREGKNTSFSAVGHLKQTIEGPTVLIYENIFCDNPIDFLSLPKCIEAVRVEYTQNGKEQ